MSLVSMWSLKTVFLTDWSGGIILKHVAKVALAGMSCACGYRDLMNVEAERTAPCRCFCTLVHGGSGDTDYSLLYQCRKVLHIALVVIAVAVILAVLLGISLQAA